MRREETGNQYRNGNPMIYITTSNGVYAYDEVSSHVSVLMDNQYRNTILGRITGGLLGRKARGYFGICHSDLTGEIIVASRERLGTRKAGKPTTDCGLHAIDPMTHEYRTLVYIKDVHDVHQVAMWRSYVLMTDTGKNRLVVIDIDREVNPDGVTRTIDIGDQREDINHVNAVTVHNSNIYIGLNNRGNSDSEILVMPAEVLASGAASLQARDVSTVITLSDVRHTHDVEPFDDTFLVSVSHDSRVINTNSLQVVFDGEDWVRGLCLTTGKLWIGQSPMAKRSDRHRSVNDGMLIAYDIEAGVILDKICLKNAGQVNDLICK